MIKYIDELKKEELASKKVLLRVDFDVPVVGGKITEAYRVKAQKETVNYLTGAGAKVLMLAHLGHEISDASFALIVEELGEILGETLTLVPHSELNSFDLLFDKCQLLLLDNIRQDPREMANDDGFAGELAKGFDFYVDDAFATIHRNHTSIVAITKHLPSYGGLLLKKEIENLSQAIEAPAEGKVLVLGGAKISTKLPVIKNFLDKCEKILIGGAIANNFFKASGVKVGSSVIDDKFLDLTELLANEKIVLPSDFLTGETESGLGFVRLYKKIADVEPTETILDIGDETIDKWSEIVKEAKMVMWNGPLGYFELKDFERGTEYIAKAIAKKKETIIGGGDTIAAADKLGLLDKFSFVSTGGGAMLDFLAGVKLAGLEALNYYD